MFYQVKVKFQKQTDEGLLKTVTEAYLVDAVSFTEAEARITGIMSAEIEGEFKVKAAAETNYEQILMLDDYASLYKCKVTFVTIDDDTTKEKKVNRFMLVAASDIKNAYERVTENMSNLLVPYSIESINSTPIVNVFPFTGE